MGETALDRKFAERLEVKREIIGLSLNDIHDCIASSLLCFQTKIFQQREGSEVEHFLRS